jgi:hypothetical protein
MEGTNTEKIGTLTPELGTIVGEANLDIRDIY